MELTIQTDFAACRRVQRMVLDEVARQGFGAQAAFAIKLALEEALVNAMKHGNRFDKTKKIHVQANITPRQAEISVEDEGSGFKRCGVPDPTLEENLEKCSGRGILLIESYMNSVCWSKDGRRICMIKENREEPQC